MTEPDCRSAPAFLFIHGFGCDRGTWQLQVEALSRSFEVVTLDLPGHGNSPLPEAHDLDALSAAVDDARRRRFDRPLIMVGHSMGCRVALRALRMSPGHVVGMAFLDGSATRRGHAQKLIERLRSHVRQHGMRATLRANFEDMFVAGSPVGLRDAVVAQALELDPAFAENLLVDLAGWDAVEALQPLANMGLPVLSIQSTALGNDMKRQPLEPGRTSPWGELLRQMIPGAWIRDVAGVGHFVHIEAPDIVNEELARFGQRRARR